MAGRIGKRSRGTKAVVGHDELGGDAVQPGTVSSLDPRGGREALMARQVGRRSCGAEAAHRKCNLARRSCKRLRGCAGQASAAHAREQ
jgi:hypothetical protein